VKKELQKRQKKAIFFVSKMEEQKKDDFKQKFDKLSVTRKRFIREIVGFLLKFLLLLFWNMLKQRSYKNLENTCLDTQTKIEFMSKKKETLKRKNEFLRVQVTKLVKLHNKKKYSFFNSDIYHFFEEKSCFQKIIVKLVYFL